MLYATIFHSKKKKFLQQLNEKKDDKKMQIFINPDYPIKLKHDSQKMIRTLRKNKIRFVVLNEGLFENHFLNEKLKENHIYAITGYRLFRALLPFIVEDICHKINFPVEKIRILLYTDEYSIENRELIQLLSQKVKQLTVVSSQYKKYQKEVLNLYKQFGYTIKLYEENGYSYRNENIIINLNQNEKDLMNFELYSNSIYISFLNCVSCLPPYWNGIIISDLIIKGPDIMEESNNQMATCEAKVYEVLKSLKDNERIFLNKNYQIMGYWGKNGKIDLENFLKLGKSFT